MCAQGMGEMQIVSHCLKSEVGLGHRFNDILRSGETDAVRWYRESYMIRPAVSRWLSAKNERVKSERVRERR